MISKNNDFSEPTPPGSSSRLGNVWIVKVLFAVAIGVVIYSLPTPQKLSPAGHRLAAILVPVIFLWVSEAIPIGITALLSTAFMVAFKVVPSNAAWAPYANQTVIFVMMIIMFGVVLNEVGLAKRLLFCILKFSGTNVKRLSFFISFSCTMLSTIFHDATVTIIMLYSILPVFAAMGITAKNSNNLSKFFIILIPLAASAGGFGTLLGGGRCPLAVEITTQYILDTTGVQIHIGFLKYMMVQFPISIFTAIATWVVCFLVFRPKEVELPASVKVESMLPMSSVEKGVGIIFIGAFILWFAGDFTGLHLTVVAALALFGFCAPGWVSFKAICDKFPWESWIVFGSGVSLGSAMLSTGLGEYLAQAVLPVMESQSTFATYYGIGLFGASLSSIMSNSAAVALSLPITLPMANMLDVNVEAIGMLSPISTSLIMLVIGCPPTIIAYSTGFFSQLDFVKVAVPWCLTLLVVVTTCIMLYWPMIGFGQ